MNTTNYVIRVLESLLQVDAVQWNLLLSRQKHPSPFMRHEYLAALQTSGSATPATGWTPRFVTLWQAATPGHDSAPETLIAACPLYLKDHSYGEYVFDWAWANAYAQHGLDYYPKAVVAVPFTPVPGSRLLARDAQARLALVEALVAWCRDEQLSSLHLLFASDEDIAACTHAGLMLRHTVQFHWQNMAPTLVASRTALPPEEARFALGRPGGKTEPPPGSFRSFEEFLATLNQEKRKKIRQERRKVSDAGVSFRWSRGRDISSQDWEFFYRCYERTYLEHGNAPYLSRDFFDRMARTMPENWLLFVAQRDGQAIAASLIALSDKGTDGKVAYGRYWGALERVDCLHFEACYYQPLQWCIEQGYVRFEGGAQGEHKMARALLPVKTHSAHWLAHPAFADAVERFLEREAHGVDSYLSSLDARSPFRQNN